MAVAALLLAIKVIDVWRGAATEFAVIARAEAQADGDQGSPPLPVPPKGTTAEDASAPAADAADMLSAKDPALFTQSELDLLANLARRRDDLEKRAGELDMRENLLRATENRIDKKIIDLKDIEKRIEALIKRHDDGEEAQLRSLVKVYENMKPKDAARIFNRLEMDVLIDVFERMKEAKMAPVLARMEPAKAKAVTVRLATRRRLPKTGANPGKASKKR